MPNDIRRRPEGALLRTYLAAAGVSPDFFEKPMVGVATVASQVFSEKPHVKELGNAVEEGIKESGALAIRWDISRSPDQLAWGHAEGYSFAWRDQLADFIESWARQQALDGLVLVGDAPETLVGMAMAATRLNIPAIMVTTGRMAWDSKADDTQKSKKDLVDPYEILADVLFTQKKTSGASEEDLNESFKSHEDYSSIAVDMALEALGLTLPGMSTASGTSRRQDLAKQTGKRVAQLLKNGTTLKQVLTPNAFHNAILFNAAIGGTVDVAVHLLALAHEAGQALSLETFDKIGGETAQICYLGGVGPSKHPAKLEDLDQAGGVWAVFHALKSQLLPAVTLSGKGAMELAKNASPKDSKVIHSSRPIRKNTGLGFVKGNLCPNGAVFVQNQLVTDFKQAQGEAQIFEDEIEAAKAVVEGNVKKGSIVVVRGQGPKGGPGLRKLRLLPSILESKGLNKSVVLITDGRLPEAPSGFFISLVSPEAAASGPLAILKDGDIIDINLDEKSILVRLTDTELRIRLARWQAPEPKSKKGFLNRYSRSVSEVNEGAVLK